MFSRFRLWLAKKLYPEIFERNERTRVIYHDYMRWLAEMKDIALVIENMKSEIDGQILSLMYPPQPEGPWEISRLREHLRLMRQPDMVDSDYPAYIPERRQQ